MSITFTKLFSSITESTVWCEPDQTRLVWITMLAMADNQGRVWASIPGLANRSRVPVEAANRAVARFLEPDQYSRTTDHDGRRIEPIDGGWRLLNHDKYRRIRDQEAIKASKRRYINERRARERAVLKSSTFSTVDQNRINAEADTEAVLNPPHPPADAVGRFRVFWDQYPNSHRKVAEEQCLARWMADGCADVFQQVMDGLGAWKESEQWAKAGGAYIPSPLIWLKQKRWLSARVKKASSAPPVWKPEPELTDEQKAAANEARKRVMAAVRVVK